MSHRGASRFSASIPAHSSLKGRVDDKEERRVPAEATRLKDNQDCTVPLGLSWGCGFGSL